MSDMDDLLRMMAEAQLSPQEEKPIEVKAVETPQSDNSDSGALAMSVSAEIKKPEVDYQLYHSTEVVGPFTWEDSRILIQVTEFNSQNREATITLKSYSPEGVDYLRTFPKSFPSYRNHTQRVFPWQEFNHLLCDIGQENLYDIEFSPDATKEYIKLITTPDFSIEFFHRGTLVKITPRRGVYFTGLAGLDTLKQNDDYYTYKMHPSELYLLPVALEKSYPGHWVSYAPEVFEMLNKQIEKRKLIAELSDAEDAIDITECFPAAPDFKFRGYQRVGVKYCKVVNMRAILAYDMGLGKTAIAIQLCESDNLRALFITKSKLKENVRREIKKLTGKDAIVFSGIQPDALTVDYFLVQKPQYSILNYDVIGRSIKEKDKTGKVVISEVFPWAELINLSQFDVIFFDEAHMMKNMESQRSKGGRMMKSPKTILMTATPVINRPDELYPLLHILDPERFSSYEAFCQAFATADRKSLKNPAKLREILAEYMIRRRKEDVEKDLPPISRIDHFHELSKEAQERYQLLLEGVFTLLDDPNYHSNIQNILTQMLRMKQVTADDKVSSSADLAQEAWEETEKKVIVFSQFKNSQIMLYDALRGTDFFDGVKDKTEKYQQCLLINGDTEPKKMYKLIDEFQENPNVKYLVLSTQMGSEGLNLTAAHTVIFNDLLWSPANHNQAEARAYGRLSDLHTVNAYYLQATNTFDEQLYALLAHKLAIINTIVEGAAETAKDMSIINELLAILKKNRKK